MKQVVHIASAEAMKKLGATIGAQLQAGTCLELVGDVGAGKTTFVKGLAVGLAIDEDVQSPSFTISRTYPARDGLQLDHYDFYRLPDPGILEYEFAESLNDEQTITVVEWSDIVKGVLPEDHVILQIEAVSDEAREVTITSFIPLELPK